MMGENSEKKTLTLGYIDPMPAYILPCFVNKLPDCQRPGLKAEVWRTFAEMAGFKLDFKKSTHIGGDGTTYRLPNQTFLFDFLAKKTINASLAVSSMRPIRFGLNKWRTQKGIYRAVLGNSLKKEMASNTSSRNCA